jgi:hypothetical protein
MKDTITLVDGTVIIITYQILNGVMEASTLINNEFSGRTRGGLDVTELDEYDVKFVEYREEEIKNSIYNFYQYRHSILLNDYQIEHLITSLVSGWIDGSIVSTCEYVCAEFKVGK